MASAEHIEGRSVGERGTATRLHALVWSGRVAELESALASLPRDEDGVARGINAKDEAGNTAMMLAIQLGDHKAVQVLLDAGASVRQKARNVDGWAAHSEAARWRDRAMLRDIFVASLRQIDTAWTARSEKLLDALELVRARALDRALILARAREPIRAHPRVR